MSLATSPEPSQLDRIEAAQQRIEQMLGMLLKALAEEPDEDAPRDTLDGDPAFPERDPLEPM